MRDRGTSRNVTRLVLVLGAVAAMVLIAMALGGAFK